MSPLPAWLQTPPPTLGLQLDAQRVTAVLVDRDAPTPLVRAVASTALPPGAVVPSLTSHNVLQRDVVVSALRGLVDQIGGRPRHVALAIPDTAAKVSLLPFDQIPANTRDLEQLVRLQLRKTVPFPVEDAQVTWSRGGAAGRQHDPGRHRDAPRHRAGVRSRLHGRGPARGHHRPGDLQRRQSRPARRSFGRRAAGRHACWCTSRPAMRRSRCCATAR